MPLVGVGRLEVGRMEVATCLGSPDPRLRVVADIDMEEEGLRKMVCGSDIQ